VASRRKMTRIRVRIDRLVLDGLPLERAQGPAVKAAVEAELSRLLAEGGIGRELALGGAVPSVPADSIRLAGGGPAQVGKQIARSVYGGIGR
jgi:hypothetical protein